ncbi:MAG: M1 family metallopeptidase [Nocardioidaceae bacterium]
MDIPSARALQAAESAPVEDPYYPDTSNPEVDVLHYFLDLAYNDNQLSGIATVTFRATMPTQTIRLDLADALEVAKVTLDDTDVVFRHAESGLTMTTRRLKPGRTHTVVIEYSGAPEPVPAPSKRSDLDAGLGWNTERDGTVYALQEPYGAFTWYPANDHPSDKALYDARITTSSPNVAVFNGTLEGKHVDGNFTTMTWHVEEPMASYLTTIAIGPYKQYSGPTTSGLTIRYWLMNRDKDLLPQLRSEGAEAFDWLVAHAGPYPFSSLGVVVVGSQSAMESQTMVTLGRSFAEIPGPTLQHEIAHQWFGDSVTPTSWQGMWLNEGWAEYMQQWFEADTEPTKLGGWMRGWRRYDDAARRASGPPGDYEPDSFGDTNVYLGPALMLNEIRKRVGDATFEHLVTAWPAQHQNENVDRAEFTRWVNDFTGEDLTSLINLWLDSSHTPQR